MNLSDNLWSFITGILILAILYVLVKPPPAGQKLNAAQQAIKDISEAMQALVRTAVG